MRQYDVFENPSPTSRGFAPYVAVLQSHHLSGLSTVIVAPLVRDAEAEITALDIRIEIHGEPLFLAIAELGAIESKPLRSVVTSLVEHEDEIRRGLDRLFTGF